VVAVALFRHFSFLAQKRGLVVKRGNFSVVLRGSPGGGRFGFSRVVSAHGTSLWR
jgi:hypothetical protein